MNNIEKMQYVLEAWAQTVRNIESNIEMDRKYLKRLECDTTMNEDVRRSLMAKTQNGIAALEYVKKCVERYAINENIDDIQEVAWVDDERKAEADGNNSNPAF